jgi:mercuric ion binding protein
MKTKMRTISQVTVLAIVMIFFSSLTFANVTGSDTVKIKTSAICGSCKTRIEKGVSAEKGVVSVDLNKDTKICTIVYKSDVTTPDKLRLAISKIGYDADNVTADPTAYKKLPACCQKGGKDND